MNDLAWMRPRLAELCGYEYKAKVIMPFYRHPDGTNMIPQHWKPDEDVAQAIRCLESLAGRGLGFELHLPRSPAKALWHCTIRLDNQNAYRIDVSLSAAVCLTIAQAMGWEETK